MNQLVPADVANLRCRFAFELYTYIKCLKYSLTCCIDDAVEAFLNYKLAASTCELDDDTICRLLNYKKATKEVDCNSDIPCSAQATIDLRFVSSGGIYSPIILPSYDTPVAVVPAYSGRIKMPSLTPNSINQQAGVLIGIVDQYKNIVFPASGAFTGQAKVGASVVVSSQYALKAYTQFALDGYNDNNDAYITSLRIAYTDNIGQFVASNFWDIDTNPYTTPYRLCGTCTPVAIADLFITSPNWATNFQVLVENAIRDLTGGVNIVFFASKSNSQNRLYLNTFIKHEPNSI